MPRTNPVSAAAAAVRVGLLAGSASTNDTPSPICRSGSAARTRPLTHNSSMGAANQRRVSNRAHQRPPAVTGSGVSGSAARRSGDQNTFGPRIASSAGTRVTATTMPMRMANAMPGPNARNAGEPATTSAAVPAAAAAPAVAMIGVYRAVARRAAVSRPSPAASCRRTADR